MPPTTRHRTPTPPTAPGPEPVPYDWSDPDAASGAPPARHPGTPATAVAGDHAFWERLPFRGMPWTRVLLRRPGLLRAVVPARRPEPPAVRPGVPARDPPDGFAGRDRPGGRAQPHPRPGLRGRVGRRALGRTPGGGPVTGRPVRRPPPTARPRGDAAAAAPTPTTLPPLDYHPTSAAPLKVLIVGDSVGLDLGQPLAAGTRLLR